MDLHATVHLDSQVNFLLASNLPKFTWIHRLTFYANTCIYLHTSNEPGDLSQWLCHDDSTINIVLVIIIIIYS